MEALILKFLHYLLSVLTATVTQTFVLLGPLVVLTLLMNFISKGNAKLGCRVFGRKGYLYLFAWLGTAVHEIGHAFFAVLFLHKITDMSLFTPNSATGNLGHVSHSYNKASIYQNIGNFWIGIGPILFGTALLFILTCLLFRINLASVYSADFSTDSLLNLPSLKIAALDTWHGMTGYLNYVLSGPGSAVWKIILLIYVSYSIGSSMTLSGADFKGAAGGFIFFVSILLFFNLGTLWAGDFAKTAFLQVSRYVSVFYFLILLSMAVNLCFLIILAPLSLIRS